MAARRYNPKTSPPLQQSVTALHAARAAEQARKQAQAAAAKALAERNAIVAADNEAIDRELATPLTAAELAASGIGAEMLNKLVASYVHSPILVEQFINLEFVCGRHQAKRFQSPSISHWQFYLIAVAPDTGRQILLIGPYPIREVIEAATQTARNVLAMLSPKASKLQLQLIRAAPVIGPGVLNDIVGGIINQDGVLNSVARDYARDKLGDGRKL